MEVDLEGVAIQVVVLLVQVKVAARVVVLLVQVKVAAVDLVVPVKVKVASPPVVLVKAFLIKEVSRLIMVYLEEATLRNATDLTVTLRIRCL